SLRHRLSTLSAIGVVREEAGTARGTYGGFESRATLAAKGVVRMNGGSAIRTRLSRGDRGWRSRRAHRGHLDLLSFGRPLRQARHREGAIIILRLESSLRGFEEFRGLSHIAASRSRLLERGPRQVD